MNLQPRKNVFLAYTPFHVLLAIGVAYSRKDAENHLLVVRNFADADNLLDAVRSWPGKPFETIVSFPGEYNLEQHSKLKRRWIRYYEVRKCAFAILDYVVNNKITEFYLFNEERPQSLCLLNYLNKKGLKAVCVEDGAVVYNAHVERKDAHYLLLGKLFYGPWWRNVGILGTSEIFSVLMAIFPELIRPELKHKKIEKIDLGGIYEFAKQDVIPKYLGKYGLMDALGKFNGIILLPYSSIFKVEPGYQEVLVRLIRYLCDKGCKIAVKYHPRDANADPLGLSRLANVHIINPAIPVEFIFLTANNNLKFVVSDSSTALMSAVWSLNKCKVVSLGELLGHKDERFNAALRSLGVALPNNPQALENLFESHG